MKKTLRYSRFNLLLLNYQKLLEFIVLLLKTEELIIKVVDFVVEKQLNSTFYLHVLLKNLEVFLLQSQATHVVTCLGLSWLE
jgi:hypothetical protein